MSNQCYSLRGRFRSDAYQSRGYSSSNSLRSLLQNFAIIVSLYSQFIAYIYLYFMGTLKTVAFKIWFVVF